MTQLSDNMTARRKELMLSVPDVHVAMNRMGYDVAFSTVASWLNGTRSVRSMEHLKALCVVLQSDLNTLAGGDIEIADGKVEATLLREVRGLRQEQREALLLLVRSMKGA